MIYVTSLMFFFARGVAFWWSHWLHLR